MTTVRFQRVSTIAGPSRPLNPATNIRQEVEPPEGPHRDWLAARGWPFAGDPHAAYRTTRLSQTYFDLLDAGLLDALDWLYLSDGLNVANSMRNWIDGKADAVSEGLTMQDGALVTNGVDSYLQLDLAGVAEKYEVFYCSLFAFATETPATGDATVPLIGTISGNDYVRLHRNTSSPRYQLRINSGITSGPSYVLENSDWRPGLWGVNRDDRDVDLMRDGEVLSSTEANASQSIPPQIGVGIGSLGATFGAQQFTAFGGGRNLTAQEWSDLNTILTEHSDDVRGLAG